MSGSLSGRASSSLTEFSGPSIKGPERGWRVERNRRREEIRRWKRWSVLRGHNADEADVPEGEWESEHTSQPVSPGNGYDGGPSRDSPLHLLASPTLTVADNERSVAEEEVHSMKAPEAVPVPPLIYDASRYSFSQHQLMRRASGSDNAPLIIGATVGGLSFVGILIIAIVVWHRRLKTKERFAGSNNGAGAGAGGRTIAVITTPRVPHIEEDKATDLGTIYRPPGSTYGTVASHSSSVNNKSRSAAASPIDKSQISHHSWSQAESFLGSPTAPAIAGLQIGHGSRIPARATTPLSMASSPSSIGRNSKRSSSLLQRFGHSRELSSPISLTGSLQTVSTSRGPPPPRPPRPDEQGNISGEQPEIFELSANPSVRQKRISKPLPVLPTFLAREYEEEMKRRREELERERKEQYEKQRRPQSPVDESRDSTPPPPGESSAYTGGRDGMGMLAKQEGVVLKKVMSLNSLASTTTSSSRDSGEDCETPGGTRRPTPQVNPLSPRSSQRKPARRESEARPAIPSFANTESESVATGGDSLLKRSSYLIADGSSGVEATAVAPGFPSPKLSEPLRLTPPLPSSASTDSSNVSSMFGVITAPVSATVTKPPILPPPEYSRNESPGTHTRTESTSSGGIAASGEHQDARRTFMIAENSSERGLPFSSIEDWRESVGETYAGTRPTTAGAGSMGPPSDEDMASFNMPMPPVIFDPATVVLQPRPIFPRRISVDTGMGSINTLSSPPVAGAFLTPSTATSTSGRIPFTPIEVVPVSAVTPPSNTKREGQEQLTLRPSTPERERGLKTQTGGARNVPKRKSVTGSNLSADKGAQSWLNVGDDSESDGS